MIRKGHWPGTTPSAQNLTHKEGANPPRTMALPWGSLARGVCTMTRGVCHVQWRVPPSSVWRAANTTNMAQKRNQTSCRQASEKMASEGARAQPQEANKHPPLSEKRRNKLCTAKMVGKWQRQRGQKTEKPIKRNVRGGGCDLLAWAVPLQQEEENRDREKERQREGEIERERDWKERQKRTTATNNGDDESHKT